MLHISDLARRYELEGGLSFRGFVDTLHDASSRAESPEAPILEEGSDGVRLMTVHKAKGLEFPVVVLADIACKLSLDDASRYLDPEKRLCAMRIGGWSPLDLQEHNAEEAKRDEAEGVRLAYVAATRARDLLIVPAVGDGPYDKGWIRPLNRALYPPRDQWQSPATGARRAALQGQADDHAGRARRRAAGRRHGSARARISSPIRIRAQPYSVVWWDPLLLQGSADDARGVRREELISKDASAGRRRRRSRAATIAGASGAPPCRRAAASRRCACSPRPSSPEESRARPTHDIAIEDAGFGAIRPSGKRFGTLVHAVLATLPLDADGDEVNELAALHAKLFAAPDDERDAAAGDCDRSC